LPPKKKKKKRKRKKKGDKRRKGKKQDVKLLRGIRFRFNGVAGVLGKFLRGINLKLSLIWI